MHRVIRRLALATAVALSMVVPLSSVLASGHLAYNIKGIEYAADATNGYFAGSGRSADDRGVWQAHVVHSGFNADNDATISGGEFVLDGRARDIAGVFTGGTVDGTPSTGCSSESFTVDAQLAAQIAGVAHFGDFDGTLTHYRRAFFGTCYTVGATIVGTVVFTAVP